MPDSPELIEFPELPEDISSEYLDRGFSTEKLRIKDYFLLTFPLSPLEFPFSFR